MNNITVTTVAERPELAGRLWDFPDSWPGFVQEDLVSWAHYMRIPVEFPECVLVATDDESGAVIARGLSVPFLLDADDRKELPALGWDQAVLWAFSDLRRGRKPDTVSAVEVAVSTAHQGRGLSGLMLAAMRENAGRRGHAELVAPVRPSAKHLEPRTPIEEYAFRTREEDGLPHDPWLRVHVRAGGVIEAVAPASMTVTGSLAQWRAWTDLPFDEDGDVEVKGALVPVHCDTRQGHAVYVEPNVWVRHAL